MCVCENIERERGVLSPSIDDDDDETTTTTKAKTATKKEPSPVEATPSPALWHARRQQQQAEALETSPAATCSPRAPF